MHTRSSFGQSPTAINQLDATAQHFGGLSLLQATYQLIVALVGLQGMAGEIMKLMGLKGTKWQRLWLYCACPTFRGPFI